MRRASGRHYPDIFKGLRPCVRDVVAGRWWNVRERLLHERHIGMAADIGNATAVQYHQSFLISRSRVPAYALTRFELHRTAPHPVRLRFSFEQWAITPGAVQGKSHRLTLGVLLRRNGAERDGDTDKYQLDVRHGYSGQSFSECGDGRGDGHALPTSAEDCALPSPA